MPAPPAVVRPAAPSRPVPPPDSLATYVWEDDVCRFTGQYSPRRYSAGQLRGTWELLNHDALLTYYATVFRPAGLDRLRLDSLDANYAKLHRHYLGLAVVPQPGWEKLKKARLRELEADYRKTRLYILGFTEPERLLRAPYSPACAQYVRGLATHNDSLIRQDWHRLVDEHSRRNGDPEEMKATYLDQAASADWRTYATIDLLTFGWSNCANEAVPRVEITERQRREFEQLFVRISSECDDTE